MQARRPKSKAPSARGVGRMVSGQQRHGGCPPKRRVRGVLQLRRRRVRLLSRVFAWRSAAGRDLPHAGLRARRSKRTAFPFQRLPEDPVRPNRGALCRTRGGRAGLGGKWGRPSRGEDRFTVSTGRRSLTESMRPTLPQRAPSKPGHRGPQPRSVELVPHRILGRRTSVIVLRAGQEKSPAGTNRVTNIFPERFRPFARPFWRLRARLFWLGRL